MLCLARNDRYDRYDRYDHERDFDSSRFSVLLVLATVISGFFLRLNQVLQLMPCRFKTSAWALPSSFSNVGVLSPRHLVVMYF